MELSTVKSHIKTKKFDNFYIFTGTEGKVMDIYIKQIASVSGKECVRVDSIADVYGKLKNRSFVNKSYIYVSRDDKEFITNDTIQTAVDSGKLLGDNIYILLLTSVDKRSKFYKKYNSRFVEFEQLTESVLVKYIQKECNLSDTNCKKLIEVCEGSYSRILLELDKIKRFMLKSGSKTPDKSFTILLEEKTIYTPPKDAIFDFVDTVLRRQVNTSFDLLEQCYAVGESTMVILSVLYNNVKQLLQVQSCTSSNVAESTGLTGWQIKCVKDKVGIYTTGDLVYFLRLIRKVEKGIKSGTIEESVAVPYVLVNVL